MKTDRFKILLMSTETKYYRDWPPHLKVIEVVKVEHPEQRALIQEQIEHNKPPKKNDPEKEAKHQAFLAKLRQGPPDWAIRKNRPANQLSEPVEKALDFFGNFDDIAISQIINYDRNGDQRKHFFNQQLPPQKNRPGWGKYNNLTRKQFCQQTKHFMEKQEITAINQILTDAELQDRNDTFY